MRNEVPTIWNGGMRSAECGIKYPWFEVRKSASGKRNIYFLLFPRAVLIEETVIANI